MTFVMIGSNLMPPLKAAHNLLVQSMGIRQQHSNVAHFQDPISLRLLDNSFPCVTSLIHWHYFGHIFGSILCAHTDLYHFSLITFLLPVLKSRAYTLTIELIEQVKLHDKVCSSYLAPATFLPYCFTLETEKIEENCEFIKY